jgi:hypothetical protein
MTNDIPPRWLSWASFRPLFRGIGQRLLLLGPIIIIVLIAAGELGDYLGLPELFWNQNRLKQAVAGFSVALLFAEICLVGFLLDAPKPWLRDIPNEAPEGWRRALSGILDGIMRGVVPNPAASPFHIQQWRQLRWYLTVSWLPLLVILVILVLLDPRERWGFLPGMAAAVAAVAIFVWLFQQLNAARVQEGLQNIIRKLPPPWIMFVLLLLAFVALLVFTWLTPASRPVIVLLLGLWVGVAGLYAGEVRYQDVPAEQRWVHGLAGTSFGTLFLVYNILFIVCLAAPHFSAWVVPPAVALCLLLALVVGGHGFLKFHFGGWYTVTAAVIIGLAIGIAGFTGYRHQLRGLDYTGNYLELEAADFQMEAGYSEDPHRLPRLVNSYDRFYQRYENQFRLLGAGHTQVPRQANLKSVPEVSAEQNKLREAMVALETQRLDTWKSKVTAGKGGKPKLAVVSVTGGANRSAVWTAHTLTRLERDLAGHGVAFPQHVRVVTGASGGMVGAAYFAATLPGPQGHAFASDADARTFVRKIGQDSLTPISQRMLFFDLPGAFVPGGSDYDRGFALEQAWDDYLGGALEKSFSDMAAGEAETWRPSLILSPMIVEDGRRLLISNLYLSPLVETTGSFLTADEPAPKVTSEGAVQHKRPKGRFQQERSRYSLTALEFFQLFPGSWSQFKLATAVRLNASFPYVSPVAALPTNPPRHVVDAGYYDNYGVNLAAWWLYHNAEWIQKNTSGVVLIQIRDSVSERARLTPLTLPEQHKVWDLHQGLEALIGPATGASQGMQAMMSFRNDELLEVLDDRFNRAGGPELFTTVVFEFPGDIAMSWYLSDQEIDRAMGGFEPGTANDQALTRLREWFKG